MTMAGGEDRTSLELPPRLDLPLFAYGLLKPGEPAHDGLLGALVGQARPAHLRGAALRLRDGLPLLDAEGEGSVEGFVLQFQGGEELAAYTAVSAFAPRQHYRWLTVDAQLEDGPAMPANVLRGRRPRRASSEELAGWTAATEPVFVFGLPAVRAMALASATAAFPASPDDSPTLWDCFFRLQAAYLLLWSALERFTALAHGPAEALMARLDRLNDDGRFLACVRAAVGPKLNVADPREQQRARRVKDDGSGAVYSWLAVRGVLGHPGKSAHLDGALLRRALVELHDTCRLHLLGLLPSLAEAWGKLDPEGAADGWLLAPVVSPEGLG